MSEKEKKMLQVGDVIYGNSIYQQAKYVIQRVTTNQAISGTTRFRREYFDDNWINVVGENRGFGSCVYKLETPELKEAFEKAKLVNFIKAFKFDELNIQVLIKIFNIIKESEVESGY